MLDNFGLGEFFFLALLALFFFGPERLPQIGAQLGRWMSSLTQYSKAFMTEWREEALVIHDAVEEVKGIRDEIIAARAEITSTLDTAREDVSEGLDAAKDAVSGATRDVTQRIQRSRQQAAEDLDALAEQEAAKATDAGSGEGAAIAKTQQIVGDLMKKRSDSSASEVAGEEAGEEGTETKDGAWAKSRQTIGEKMDWGPITQRSALQKPVKESEAEEPVDASVAQPSGAEAGQEEDAEKEVETEDEAWLRNYQAVQEIMQRGPSSERDVGEEDQAQELEAIDPSGTSSTQVGSVKASPEEEAEEEPKRESAFDRTQKILDDLRKKRTSAQDKQPASIVGTQEQGEPETASDVVPASDVKGRTLEYHEFERLSAQVTQLEGEVQALKAALHALRAESSSRALSVTADGLGQTTEQAAVAESLAETDAATVPIEEVI